MKTDLDLARAFARAMNPPDPVSVHDMRAYMNHHPGTSNADRLRTARSLGAVRERFGEAVIVAAALQNVPGGCRWCVARLHATAHDQAPPKVSAATRLLLNDPCPKDVAAFRQWMAGRVADAKTDANTFLITRKRAETEARDARVRELTALMAGVRDELAELRPGVVAAAATDGSRRTRMTPEVLSSLSGKPVPSEGRMGWKRR